ncbi:FecR family protein [Halioglobus maricola]|uniref:FecR family protein n=1 Tax=Halioglobus maricola TaxID=2601894 RepID=A0A5P9NFH7_9GAMM|nr:FecR family protein [Halioglobus maricola]QFU74246.1 FecR family protein [Halioglobus maricola]
MEAQGNRQYEQACDAALGWIARLRSDDVSATDRQSFALWLGENASHRTAMDQMLDMWDDLGVLQVLPEQAPAELPREAANASRWYTGAAAIAASIMLALFLYPQLGTDPVSTEYRTAVGERLSIELPDNSTVVLNTDSSISVTYTDEQRHIDLRRGEAWFQVNPNKERPFHVDAGETRVTAVGTAFNVYLQQDATAITVTEGVVRVSEIVETGSHKPASKILSVNQQLRTSSDGWALSPPTDFSARLAWRQGELVADEMLLVDLVAELERYHNTNYLIADPSIAGLSISGVLQLDEPEAILKALEVSLGVQADTLESGTVRLLKAEQ